MRIGGCPCGSHALERPVGFALSAVNSGAAGGGVSDVPEGPAGMTMKSSVRAGGYLVAELVVDPARISGAGGPWSPVLVVPLDLVMSAQEKQRTLVVEELVAELWVGTNGQAPVQLGSPYRINGSSGRSGQLRSYPHGATTDSLQLRFRLTQDELRGFEQHAHRHAPSPLALELRLEAHVAWARRSFGAVGADEVADFPSNFGFFSEMLPLAQCDVENLTIQLSRERLAEEILPGLGLDRLRLIAVQFPPQISVPRFHERFDFARTHFDAFRYEEAVAGCRDARKLVEQAFGATSKEPVAVKAARIAGLATDAPAVLFLDGIWRSLADLTNEAKHGERGHRYTAAEARAALITLAAAVELLNELLAPRR
jgi:hypothetical protein